MHLWSGLPTPAMYKRTKLLLMYVRYGELAPQEPKDWAGLVGAS